MLNKIGFGGGCHWCTEAVFQSLKGVEKVDQGFVASIGENHSFSEAVIVYFDAEEISANTLVEIHLHTHKSSSNHSMRDKYRSAIYAFSETQKEEAITILNDFQKQFDHKLITQVLSFKAFRPSADDFMNYYYSNPEKPFCKVYIQPKLRLLLQKFSKQVVKSKLEGEVDSVFKNRD